MLNVQPKYNSLTVQSAGVQLSRLRFASLLIVLLLFLQGCASNRDFMPTPNLFLQEDASQNALTKAQEQDQPELEILYVTDRSNESTSDEFAVYKNARSNAAAFGVATVGLKPDVNWQTLSDATYGDSEKVQICFGDVVAIEHGRYPTSPYLFKAIDGQAIVDDQTIAELNESNAEFRQLILSRLERRDTNDVVLFVHGFNNSFEYAAQTLAGIDHFLQRRQVPILYSWPAGAGGIRGYFVDSESGQFTIFHLKETLRTLMATPEIDNLHIIAHSRGTDVITAALRELIIENRGTETNTKELFGIENLILAAPDLDYGVIRQRLMAEAFGSAFGHITVYSTKGDKALSISQFLVRGVRFGLLASDDIDKRDKSILERAGNVDFVQAQSIKSFTGHDYFVSDPAVSSDLLTLINHGTNPGSKLRPLIHEGGNFWLLPDNYPDFE